MKATDILMNVYTDNPIIHIYTGDYIPVLHPKNRNAMGPLSGICFEAQGYSDAPNQPNFPNNYLTPQENTVGIRFLNLFFNHANIITTRISFSI